MTDLLWDDPSRTVLELRQPGFTIFRWRLLDDSPLSLPPCPDRIGPGGSDLAGDVTHIGSAANARSVRIRKPGAVGDCEPCSCRLVVADTRREPLAVGGANTC